MFLMDTQGTFDSNSTVFENAFIFALTLMVSSVTVYNIMHNLQEDNLQHLSFFAEYGVLALDAYQTTPFQQLTFLIRDWQFEYETSYGFQGGEEILADRFKVSRTKRNDRRRSFVLFRREKINIGIWRWSVRVCANAFAK